MEVKIVLVRNRDWKILYFDHTLKYFCGTWEPYEDCTDKGYVNLRHCAADTGHGNAKMFACISTGKVGHAGSAIEMDCRYFFCLYCYCPGKLSCLCRSNNYSYWDTHNTLVNSSQGCSHKVQCCPYYSAAFGMTVWRHK